MDVPGYAEGMSEAEAIVDEADDLRQQHRYADAERCSRRAIALDPRLPRARSVLGLVLRDTGRFDDAEAAFRQAIRLDPASETARRNLARIKQARKRGPWLKNLPVRRRPHP